MAITTSMSWSLECTEKLSASWDVQCNDKSSNYSFYILSVSMESHLMIGLVVKQSDLMFLNNSYGGLL